MIGSKNLKIQKNDFLQLPLLLLIIFITSFAVMSIELLAGRLVSRYLGQSLYTWTSIIGVILAGISFGNYLGGKWADQNPTPKQIALGFWATALGVWLLLALNYWIGHWHWLSAFDWPGHIFIHVLILLFGPATLLGTLSPLLASEVLKRSPETKPLLPQMLTGLTHQRFPESFRA